ncbi:MAG: sigma-70 family RNA polymerase sigma factor [Ruminococcaceae bacterium]|nr:sigma-70 family RNA polymerase sigma factor [Oscillospiraceae bacterium]
MCSFGTDEYMVRLVKTYSDSMLRAAYSVLKSTDDAEDAVQDAFLRLVQKRPQFKNYEHEKAWLLRVTINISKNMLKSAARNNLPVTEEIPCLDEKSELLAVVMSLPERYRTVIHLYYFEGYSIKEIAAVLKLPSATVGTRLARARNLLKGEIADEF